MDWKVQIKQALRVAVPLVALETPDPDASLAALVEIVTLPVVAWTVCDGWAGVNKTGQALMAELTDDDLPITNPVEAVQRIRSLSEQGQRFVAVIQMAGRVIDASPLDVNQVLRSCRNPFKQAGCLLILMGASIRLPIELASDTLLLTERLPDMVERDTIISKMIADFTSANPDCPAVSGEDMVLAREATSGLTAFGCESAVAMSLSRKGLQIDVLREKKKQQIAETRGLEMIESPMNFGAIGGCDAYKTFLTNLRNGQEPFTSIIRMEELEKAFDGIGTDSSGVVTEMLGLFLTWTSKHKIIGSISYGQPGAAKSVMAEACGTEFGLLTVDFDLTACKGSYVGDSSANMRRALGIIEAIGGGNPLFIATSNGLDNLPGELLRRFDLPHFFFDLPTSEERVAIWSIYLKKYELVWEAQNGNFSDVGWTGAEIEKCCKLAWRLRLPLSEAAKMVIPIAVSDKERIEGRRKGASGRYQSASVPGVYMHGAAAAKVELGSGRKFAPEAE